MKEEKEFQQTIWNEIFDFSSFLKHISIEGIEHPTKVLIQVIEETYGHKVKMKELIKLIEKSPLKEVKK